MEKGISITLFCQRCTHMFSFKIGGNIPQVCPACAMGAVPGFYGYPVKRRVLRLP